MALQLRLVVAVCLLLFLSSTGRAAGLNISDIGGVLTENLTLSLSGSPYSVVRDLVVPANAILTVERGVQLWFNATGITVRGALIANGTGDDKIVMRAHPDAEADFNLTRSRSYPNVRLNPLRNRHNEGRLEIFHSGQWGTVCHWSESGTWSDRESTVACRMLGFPEGGRYTSSYRWYSRPSAWLYNVRCTGTEVSLEDCQHNEVGTVNTGRPAYCGTDDDVGLVCYGTRNTDGRDLWKGIQFDHAAFSTVTEGRVRSSLSPSLLNHVTIDGAGAASWPAWDNSTAVSIRGAAPVMRNLNIVNSFTSGVKVLDMTSNLRLSDITLAGNGAISVETTPLHNVYLHRVDIEDSRRGSLLFKERNPSETPRDFCTLDTTGNDGVVTFPVFLQGYSRRYSSAECVKVIPTDPGKIVTVHYVTMSSDPWYGNAPMVFQVRDGTTEAAPFLDDGSRVMAERKALSTGQNNVWLRLRSAYYSEDRFTIVLTSQDQDISGSPVIIEDCKVPNGIHLSGYKSAVKIAGTEISSSRGTGLFSDGKGDLSVAQTTFTGNSNGIVVVRRNAFDTANIDIKNVTFHDTRKVGLRLENPTGVRLSVAYSQFIQNSGVSIVVSNFETIESTIINNTFSKNSDACIVFSKQDSTDHPFEVVINENLFFQNRGPRIVHLDIPENTDASVTSVVEFEDNILDANKVVNPFQPAYGCSRKCLYAVLVIHDLATTLQGNVFTNPAARYQLSTTGPASPQPINATHNYWGTTEQMDIARSVYGRSQRYTLREISYSPYFLSPTKTNTSKPSSPVWPDFYRADSIGGVVQANLSLSTAGGPYYVARDIIIPSASSLYIEPGTTLEFAQDVGLFVQGRLVANGSEEERCRFMPVRRANSSTPSGEEDFIRLVGGNHTREGFVQVFTNGAWQAICRDDDWLVTDSEKVCQYLGYRGIEMDVLDKRQSFQSTWQRNLTCGDLFEEGQTRCLYSINSTECASVLYVVCEEAPWLGLHFTLTAAPSVLINADVTGSRTGLRIDFHRHRMSNIRVRGVQHNGIVLRHLDALRTPSLCDNCSIKDIGGHGIQVYSSSSSLIRQISIQNVVGNGIDIRGFTPEDVLSATSLTPLSARHSICSGNRALDAGERVIVELKSVDSCVEFWSTVPDNVISVQAMFKNSNVKLSLSVHDGGSADSGQEWTLGDDGESDVFVSTGQAIALVYRGSGPDNNTYLLIEALPIDDRQQYLVDEGMDRGMIIEDTTMYNSGIGVFLVQSEENNLRRLLVANSSAMYCNQGMQLVNVSANVIVKESTLKENNVSGITVEEVTQNGASISINASEISWNGEAGLEMTFSDSTYRKEIAVSGCRFEGNVLAALSIVLEETQGPGDHLVSLSFNTFHDAGNPAMKLEGSSAEWNIMGNTFSNNSIAIMEISGDMSTWNFEQNSFIRNRVERSLIITFDLASSVVTLEGNTFKDNEIENGGVVDVSGFDINCTISSNTFQNNSGWYVIDIAVSGHFADGTILPVVAVSDNRLEGNLFNQSLELYGCAVFVESTQNVPKFQYNRLYNPQFNWELCMEGSRALSDSVFEAPLNWWGSSDAATIRKRIFDFDDWNDHPLIDFSPFLISSEGNMSRHWVRMSEIGGRIFDSVTLTIDDSPYLVSEDITVLPNATLNIQPGVELQFAPNVGILVEGSLKAMGEQDNIISMTPGSPSLIPVIRTDRFYGIRLADGANQFEGRVEIFVNGQWGTVCDDAWGLSDAIVACRQLGFGPPVDYRRYFGQGTGPIWLDDVSCSGNEATLLTCRSRGIGSHNCGHYEDVGIKCAYGYGRRRTASLNFVQGDRWGNIRVQATDMELSRDVPSSVLQFVTISGAGVLHGVDVPAVQAIGNVITLQHVNIHNCSTHGIELVSPSKPADYNTVKVNMTTSNTAMNLVEYNKDVVLENIEATGGKYGIQFKSLWDYSVTTPYLDTRSATFLEVCDKTSTASLTSKMIIFHRSSYLYRFARTIDCSVIIKAPRNHRIHLKVDISSVGSGNRRLVLYDGSSGNQISSYTYVRTDERTSSSDTVRMVMTGYIYFTCQATVVSSNRTARVNHVVANSIIQGNNEAGLVYTEQGTASTRLRIVNTVITDNSGDSSSNPPASVSIRAKDALIEMINNTVQNNNGGIRVRLDGPEPSNTDLEETKVHKIINNTFSHNYGSNALSFELLSEETDHLILQGNTAENNEVSAAGRGIVTLTGVHTELKQNTFGGNKGEHVFIYQDRENGNGKRNISIRANIFKDTVEVDRIVDISGTSTRVIAEENWFQDNEATLMRVRVSDGLVQILENSFQGNSDGLLLFEHSSMSLVEVIGNKFTNNIRDSNPLIDLRNDNVYIHCQVHECESCVSFVRGFNEV